VKVLVTGGAGFIGSNLVRRLLDHGDEVVVLDEFSTGFRANLDGLDLHLVEGSILDDGALGLAVKGADSIVHLAALGSIPRSIANPVAAHEVNATGTLRVLEAARKTGAHVTVASSSSVYGSVPDLPRVETLATRPMSPYGASKLAAEGYTLAYGKSYGVETLPLRLFNVYGQRQVAGHAYAAVIPVFIDAALRGIPLPLQGDGRQSRDFTFVDTVTWVLAHAAHYRITSDVPVNVAMGANISLLELIAELEPLVGHSLEIEERPERVGDVQASCAELQRFRRLFPSAPTVTFTEGLAATVEWTQSSRIDHPSW